MDPHLESHLMLHNNENYLNHSCLWLLSAKVTLILSFCLFLRSLQIISLTHFFYKQLRIRCDIYFEYKRVNFD